MSWFPGAYEAHTRDGEEGEHHANLWHEIVCGNSHGESMMNPDEGAVN
jgi:hypothetical protein